MSGIKVYCSNCKYFDEDTFLCIAGLKLCLHPDNMKNTVEHTWYRRTERTVSDVDADIKNANNNCEWFKGEHENSTLSKSS